MSIATDIVQELQSDDTLMDILTGGVYTDKAEINRQDVPDAFDANGEILPCALVKLGVETPRGPYSRSVQTPLIIYFYQRAGYTSIGGAMTRTYNLLHEKKVGSTTWQVLYDSSVFHQRDAALDCPLSTLRFIAVLSR